MSSLFDPLVFRTGLRAKNRLALAPMTNTQSHDDGSLGEDELRWLTSRADGGYGTIMTCAAHVAKEGQGWRGELGIFDDAQLPGLSRLAAELRRRDAVSIVQIFHGGVRADAAVSGLPTWSSSDGEGALAATEADLERVIGQFAAAAGRAKAAGFDGVEIHGAHGYLFTQFLSATHNRRTDRWGGSLENRARLLRQVTRAIREEVGPTFTVGVRMSPEDFGFAKGLDLDETVEVARWLSEDQIDFVHLSLWRAALPTRKRPEEHAIPLFRAALPADVRILAAGAVWTRAEAEDLLAKGADGVALGRAAIGHPDWPQRIREEGWEPSRPPFTVEHLVAHGVSPRFAEYLRVFKGFIA